MKKKLVCEYVFEEGRIYKSNDRGTMIKGPKDLMRFIPNSWRNKPQEHFYLLLLDTRHRVMKKITMTKGTLNASLVHPRDVFREAIRMNAAAVIAIHNHPSGDPAPSEEDIQLTQRLNAAGELMGISLLDHLIVVKRDYISMREDGRGFDGATTKDVGRAFDEAIKNMIVGDAEEGINGHENKIIKDRYLGDGVYASFDGFSIWLDLRGQDSTTKICLEPSVLAALNEFKLDTKAAWDKRKELGDG